MEATHSTGHDDEAPLLGEAGCLLKAPMDIRFKCCFCTFLTTDFRGIVSHLGAHDDEQSMCQPCPTSLPSSSKSNSVIPVHAGGQLSQHPSYLKVVLERQPCLSPVGKRKSKKADTVKQGKHTGKKPYKCMHCLKDFARRSQLITHDRTRTGHKPYKCELCPKAFAKLAYLTYHVRTHTGEKPFKCGHCPKAYAQKSCLTTHILMHTGEKPYMCELCPQAFIKASHLSIHIRTHTGEKPFKCGHCPKAFAVKNSLTRHILTHTGEKPHKCKLCPQAFTQRPHLAKHIRMHTGESLTSASCASKAGDA